MSLKIIIIIKIRAYNISTIDITHIISKYDWGSREMGLGGVKVFITFYLFFYIEGVYVLLKTIYHLGGYHFGCTL